MINLSRDSRTSRTLSFLRFPLAALIVFIHTGFSNDTADPSFWFGKLLSEGVANVAVPAFFFISGYLFFAKYDNFGCHEYLHAMKRKFLTLGVPYLLWIALVYYGMGAYTHFIGSPHPWEFYKIFWASSDGYVAKSIFGYEFSILSAPSGMGVLWFIRDLLVAMALSPLIWMIVRKFRMWSVILFLIPYFLYIAIPIQGFGLVALCFFPIGATFSICGKTLEVRRRGIQLVILTIFLVLLLTKFILDINSIHYHRIINQLMIISGVAASIVIGDIIMNCAKMDNISKWICFIGEASFFIYVGHALPIFNLLNKILTMLQDIPIVGYTLYYFLYWGLRLAIVTTTYFCMKRYCPRILSVLVGGRVNKPIKIVAA